MDLVLVRKEVAEVFVLYKMEVWPRLKVFGYDQILIRRMAEVEEVEEVEGEDGLDEKMLADLPV